MIAPSPANMIEQLVYLGVEFPKLRTVDVDSRSNEMSPEVRAKVAGEITAGMAIATSPKPDRDWLRLLLIHPLKWLAEKVGSAIINKLAGAALELLFKLTGLSP
jgi:hypothetical protein